MGRIASKPNADLSLALIGWLTLPPKSGPF